MLIKENILELKLVYKQFIEERITETESELIAAEEALKVFMDRNRRIENSPALQLENKDLVGEVTVLTGIHNSETTTGDHKNRRGSRVRLCNCYRSARSTNFSF